MMTRVVPLCNSRFLPGTALFNNKHVSRVRQDYNSLTRLGWKFRYIHISCSRQYRYSFECNQLRRYQKDKLSDNMRVLQNIRKLINFNKIIFIWPITNMNLKIALRPCDTILWKIMKIWMNCNIYWIIWLSSDT